MKKKPIIKYSISILLLISFCFNYAVFGDTSKTAEKKNVCENNVFENIGNDSAVSICEPIVLLSEKGEATVNIEVKTEGDYSFGMAFRPTDKSSQKISYALYINGDKPFEQSDKLEAPVIWKDSTAIRKLSSGDEATPTPEQIDGYMLSYAFDKTGIIKDNYTFHLNEGIYSISIVSLDSAFELGGIVLKQNKKIPVYSETVKGKDVTSFQGDYEPIVIEAEKPLYKNAYSLSSKSITNTANVTPYSTTKSLINCIGGSNWSDPGQEITWSFKAPADGYYKVAFSYLQNTVINGFTYRKLKIDGEVPFSEAKEIRFPYNMAWEIKSLSDTDGNDYYIYLSKGEHTISLEVTLAEISQIYYSLNEILQAIGDTYLDIVMITGESPDKNRDYELYKQIPDFNETLKNTYEKIDALSQDINTKYHVNGELDGSLKNMSRVLKKMHDNKYQSHIYLELYYSYYQALSSWLYDIKNMSLSLDKIIICPTNKNLKNQKAGFFERLRFGTARFIYSFANDYTSSGSKDSNSENTIKIWVNWGRDQVKVLNSLVQETFTPKNNINVKIEQVNASLVQGLISGNPPDLYLQLARTEPINLAMRGVLYDLKNFDDYDEVIKSFQNGSQTPYMYHGGAYALSDTQGFYVMFYRSDIFNELKLSVPKTWDDFLAVTSIVQRKNMNSYLPYLKITASTTVNTGAGGLSIFPTMLIQHGQKLYNDALNATTLNSPIAVSTFKQWTDFYSKYKLNPDANFYQRFRVGTIPLGITTYSQYQTFAVAASEIEGKWKIAELPGIQEPDGTINNSTAGSGTGCSIMKASKHKKEAWEFLKWWISADTQYNYSANVEALLGQSGRVSTANVEALKRLSWDKDALDVILSQWSKVREIDEVPGSYYVSRSIDQAFWEVYNKSGYEKKALTEWAEVSNDEITRKINEYANKKY